MDKIDTIKKKKVTKATPLKKQKNIEWEPPILEWETPILEWETPILEWKPPILEWD